MVKNNHQFEELERSLLDQKFVDAPQEELLSCYANVENALAVLSDLSQNKSYIYNGAMAELMGFRAHKTKEIESIWEEEIYQRIHPDDLSARNIQELYFFRLLKKTAQENRTNYITHSTLRMKDAKGRYLMITHRTVYLCSQSNGTLWLVLCLYNLAPISACLASFQGVIQNTKTGELIKPEDVDSPILSQREIEVLKLIEQGLLSKEIARTLSLSINTVNRHRQNIIEKLRVNSSIEAIRKSRMLSII